MKKLSELVMIFHLYSALMINIFSYLMTFLEKWLKTSIFQDGISLLGKRILERVSPVLLETISQMGRDKRVMRKSGELQFCCFNNLNIRKHLVFLQSKKRGGNKAKHTNKQKPTNQTKTLKAEKKITELKGPTRPVTTLFLFICMGISITI